ncbi:type I restriction enzyme S subunit [Bradyrhizobium japonicum]
MLNGPTEFGPYHPNPTQFTTDPKKLSRPGDVLFCVRGSTTGRMNWSDQIYAIGRGIAAIRHRSNERLQPLIRAAIEHDLPRLLQSATGSTFPNVSATQLAGVAFPSFSQSEEIAASSLLGALDDKIDLNRRMNETLEAMARAIFKDWFVDFGPTRAKMERSVPYLAPDLWSLFPHSVDADGKPEGWERISLREAAQVHSGGTPTKENREYWNGDIPWISPKVMTGIHVSNSNDRVTAAAIGRGTRLAPFGSVLVMVRGMGLHQGVRISQARRDVTFNQDVKALLPRRLSGTHLLFGLLDATPYLFSKVEASGHGTGTLPTKLLEGLDFVVPDGPSHFHIIQPLDALNNKIAANQTEDGTLAALRDLLLPKLISGEIRVKDAEKIVEAAL